MRRKGLLIIVVVVMIFLCACGSKNKFVGTWRATDDDDVSFGEIITLNEDGTGTVDGISISWDAEDGIFHWSCVFGSDELTYGFKGSRLYLDGCEYQKRKD